MDAVTRNAPPPPPWHNLGRVLPAHASPEEVAHAAGFYRALEREVYVEGRAAPLPDVKALVREDTGHVLSLVGRSYTVVQFDDLARTFAQAAAQTGVQFVAAGVFGRHGARAWLLCELPGALHVRFDRSPLHKYVLCVAGHDAATALHVRLCAHRVLCSNAIGVALSEREGAAWTIPHRAHAQARLADAARAFGQVALAYGRLGALANALVARRLGRAAYVRVLDAVLPLPPDDEAHPRLRDVRAKALELFETGAALDGLRGTAWGAFQSLSELADHHLHTRAIRGRQADEMRLESVWLGRAALLKRRALEAVAGEVGVALAA